MPGPIAPLVGFVIGVALAWAAGDELARSHASPVGSRSLVVVALFATLVFAPIASYFLAFDGDWAFAYLLDTRRVPSAVELALVLVDAASVPLGFVVAASRARARRLAALSSMAIPPSLVAFAAVVAVAPRLAIQASYAQFHGDFGTRPVAGSPLGYGLLWMDALLVAGALFTARTLRKLGRERM